jgi:NTP pyrophosphatase (non-canonical NTP hydrolase)
MIQEELQEFIEKWAEDKGLLKEENAPKQMLKLSEEVGELAGAYLKNKHEEIVDAIGDIQVVLIILSKQLGLDYNQCLEGAYNVIKNRTGKLVNGSFIKD